VDIDNLAVLLQPATSTASGRVLKSCTRAGHAETEDRNAIQNIGSEPSSLWSGGIGDVHDVLHSVTMKIGAQDEGAGGWRITRAQYGWRDRQTDVTDLLQDLIARGGVNGRVVVNNQTMRGDPRYPGTKRRELSRAMNAIRNGIFSLRRAKRSRWACLRHHATNLTIDREVTTGAMIGAMIGAMTAEES
jgi:hypothetical protein